MAKKGGSKSASKKIEGAQAPKMGKPVSHHESTHHSVDIDSKGKKHHRVHHSVETTYEYPDKADATPMNEMLSKRGY